jgi:hypothetical protein
MLAALAGVRRQRHIGVQREALPPRAARLVRVHPFHREEDGRLAVEDLAAFEVAGR